MTTMPATPAEPTDTRLWRLALTASGALLVVLGAVALFAWAVGEQDYLQISQDRPPLHYNGALAFLVWGGAHLALARGRPRLARALALVLGAFGGLVLFASLPWPGLRLDRWAFEPSRYAAPVGPGGVAPGMGLGCALAGVALALGAARFPTHRGALLGTLVGMFLAIGAPAILLARGAGPLLGPSHGALLGGVGATIAGLGLLPFWFRKGARVVALGQSLPVAVGGIGIGLTFALWLALNADQEERIQRQVQFEVAHVRKLLQEQFPAETRRVAELAEKWPEPPADNSVPEQMRLDAGNAMGVMPGCLGVARVNARQQVAWVERLSVLPSDPVPGRGPARSVELGGGEELTAAVLKGEVAAIRPPRSGWNGQRVLLLFAPHRAKQPLGGFVAVVSVQQLFATILNTNVAPGYAVTVSEGAEPVFTRFGSPQALGDRWSQSMPVKFSEHPWAVTVTVSPTPETLARESLSLPRIALLIGLALTGLLALAVHLAQTARNRTFALEGEVRERELAELALRQSEEKYRSLIENLGQGIFLQDAEHKYVAANGPFCKSVGRAEAEVVGATEAHLFDPERAARHEDEVRLVLAEGRSIESEIEGLDGDRRTWVRRVLTPVRDAAGRVTGVLGICWDVTQQRQLEEHVNQASKMDAIGQLAGGIAHDFNNLLTVILGNLEVLLADADPGHPDRPLLASAQSAGQRAAALTQRLLGFSRRHQLDWRPTSINGVVAEVVALLQRTIDPLTRIETDLDPDLWPVESDPTQLNQVLMNLCINARDAIGGSGVIGIATRCVTGAEVACPGDVCLASGGYVRLRVTDTGAGMPPEVKARMFEPFFTTKGVGKGTGLGLAMVFAIVRQHKGWIDCASEVGAGTRFDIYLPRGTVAKPAASAPAPLPARRAGQGTVLVVDDEELIRALAAAALQAAGYNVIQAADGQEAVDVYTKQRDHIDLVLLDLTMPVLSGHEAFQRLVGLNPRVKVLLVSGYSTEQLSDLEREKMVGFVKKPYRPSDLVATVDDALPGRSGFRMKALSGAR